MRVLKLDNQLHSFRTLEQCCNKQINCDDSIEFLCLCKDFDLTPTIAKVDHDKRHKWKHSPASYSKNIFAEELCHKLRVSASLKLEINLIYKEIHRTCGFFRYTYILQTMTERRKKYYQDVLSPHIKKILRLLSRDEVIDEHIINNCLYKLSFS